MVAQTHRTPPRRPRRARAGRVVLSDTATAWPKQTWNNGNIYPDMPKVPQPGGKRGPDLDMIGAPGVTIMSGILDPTSVGEYNPDFGWLQGIQIYDTMRRNDAQIQALEHMVTMPFHRAKWTIKPGGDDAKSKEIADFIETCLFHDMSYVSEAGNTFTQSWSEILRHILLHIFYGFSLMEVCWKKEDGWIKWARWIPIMQRTLYKWWVDNGNDLTGIEIYTWKNARKEYIDIPIGKLLHWVYKQEGNNPEGMAGLRPVYKHWYYKDRYYAIEAVGIERSAVSPPVFKHGPNPTPNDITRGQDLVQNLRVNEYMGLTIRNDEDVEILRGSQKQAAQVQPSIEHHDNEIARAFLVQFLNLGSKEVGSYALAQGQIQMFLAAYQAIASYIADIINPEIRRLVDWNFEGVEVYPTLQCSKLIAQDLTTLTTAWKDLNSGNAPLLNPSPEIAEYMLEELGLPQSVAGTQPTTNPTAPENPDRPDQRPNDHTTEMDTPPKLSEALLEARMLRESMTALDAVERGYRFGSPNQPRVPAGNGRASGEWTKGGGGGAGGGSEHTSRGSGRHAIEGVTHVSRGSGGSGGGGGHGDHSTEHAPKATRASDTGKTAAQRVEEMHATAHRLQQEAAKTGKPLAEEVKPAPKGEVLQLVPQKGAADVVIPRDQLRPTAQQLKQIYGEHQLGAALTGYSTPSLKEMAHETGADIKGAGNNHAAIVSAITSHVTEGRYSADFRGHTATTSGTKTTRTAKSGDTISRAEHTRLQQKYDKLAAEHEELKRQVKELQRHMKAGQPKAKGEAKGATKAENPNAAKGGLFKTKLVPVGTVEDRPIQIGAHPDAAFLRQVYGEHQLHDALDEYSHTTLRGTIRDLQASGHAIEAGKTKEETIGRIIDALHAEDRGERLQGQSKAARGSAAKGKGKATESDRTAQVKSGVEAEKAYARATAKREAILRDLERERVNHRYDPNFTTRFKSEHGFDKVVAEQRQARAHADKIGRSLTETERQQLQRERDDYEARSRDPVTPREDAIAYHQEALARSEMIHTSHMHALKKQQSGGGQP